MEKKKKEESLVKRVRFTLAPLQEKKLRIIVEAGLYQSKSAKHKYFLE